MPRFAPATPRSRRLGRDLRKLREAKGLTGEEVAKSVRCSSSRISRIESGEIKPRAGDVMELLVAYGVPLDAEPGSSLLAQARDLREDGWWQRVGGKYATYIAYETEAVELKNYEPTLVPGLLQTERYARAVNIIGREVDPDTVNQRVATRMTRQEVLHRQPTPLRLHAVLSEAALRTEVGGPDVLRDQLSHLVTLSELPNVTIQVLRFEAGAHLADSSGFALLSFERDDPPLGYIETLAGELFLESTRDLARISAAYDNLRMLAMSPAESVKLIKELSEDGT
ncbi:MULTISPECIES: helix-turn-helix transcriptional regulator [unclassified Solwaraspora]|uniref:helix-turn-helix domain-containing protein n=1 Tax=unclassified Solwaraspora TaxID=2627926 RepID=UPI00249AAA9D|nr:MULTISPECIES: helix-turn-helix transcriptional regulator [unclassified Solwaraspora]WFE23594.1 helix-turn-helix transcriptional regulator [Solwaraspora sp. WMMD937]WJK32387.1 helix-turn-helix transcriptional regulator [Solwaraspora sp. WMMA2065]